MKQKPSLQGIDLIAVSPDSIQEVSSRLSGCARCTRLVDTTIECVLDDLIGSPSGIATYIVGEALQCPNCGAPILETTPVRLKESPADSDTGLRRFMPPLPGTEVVLIDEPIILETESLIAACEHCATDAEISFDYLLDALTGCDPTQTEYLMWRQAKCPQCFHEVTEKSLIIPL